MEMLNFMRLFSTAQNAAQNSAYKSAQNSAESTNVPKTLMDKAAQTPALEAVKAAIPYMELETGRKFALIVKFMEIQKILEIFDTQVHIETAPKERSAAILAAMRPHLGGGEGADNPDFLDMFDKMSKMKDMMGMMGGGANGL